MFELVEKFYDNIEDILEPFESVEKSKKLSYINVSTAFDIEVSSFLDNDEKRSLMYAFVLGINGKCVRGREWSDFKRYIQTIVDYYDISQKHRLIIWVHNLSYEFQFIKDMFEWVDLLSIEQRKPIYALTSIGIEFRCSYLLSGLNLAKVGENLQKYKIQKMVGDLDYKLIRTPQTELTDKEWGYILNDGLVLMAYIQEEIEQYGSVSKFAYTKTGKVRNLCRNNCFKKGTGLGYYNLIKELTLTSKTYQEVKSAYAGGFTHASAYKVGRTWKDVSSFDFTSSYPAVMLSEFFPMSEPYHVNLTSLDEFHRYLRDYNCFFEIKFYNLRNKFKYESYISDSHCFDSKGVVYDNGRVREAEEVSLAITEVDYEIICQVYSFDYIEVSNFYYCDKDYLPKELIETTLDLYQKKTMLKGVVGKEQEYLNSKEMLNSLYGMCVTDIVRDEIKYENGEWLSYEVDVDTEISKYNNSRSRFLYYLWGVWISAYARRNLWYGIIEFGEDYIYSDTDSLKVLNKDKHMAFINSYNRMIDAKVKTCLGYYRLSPERARPCNIKGIEKPIGVWDYEGTYDLFKTLGAKRYIYSKDGDLEITISGVVKKNGREYLLWKYKTLEKVFSNFNDNIEFPATYIDNDIEKMGTGKNILTYIDKPTQGAIQDYKGDYYLYYCDSGIYMEAGSYVLNMDIQFIQLLKELLNEKRVTRKN